MVVLSVVLFVLLVSVIWLLWREVNAHESSLEAWKHRYNQVCTDRDEWIDRFKAMERCYDELRRKSDKDWETEYKAKSRAHLYLLEIELLLKRHAKELQGEPTGGTDGEENNG